MVEDKADTTEDFLFVHVDPSSNYTATTFSRRSIRSQVMRNLRKQRKSRNEKAEKGSDLEGQVEQPLLMLNDSTIAQHEVATKWKYSKFQNVFLHSSDFQDIIRSEDDLPFQWIITEPPADTEETPTALYNSYKIASNSIAKSPLTSLGAGSIDPFKTYPGMNNSHYVAEMLDSCKLCSLSYTVSYFPRSMQVVRHDIEPVNVLCNSTDIEILEVCHQVRTY